MDKIQISNVAQSSSLGKIEEKTQKEQTAKLNTNSTQEKEIEENSLTDFLPIPEDTRKKKNIFQKIADFFKNLFATKDTDKDSRYDVNGELDMDAHQGRFGDCALIGACYSLQYSEAGKEVLHNAIKINKNDKGKVESYTVNFKGVGKSYTITKSELEKADALYNKEGSRHYSVGDDDMLLLELAYSKLVDDVGESKLQEYVDDKGMSFSPDALDGINHNVVMYALTGQAYDNIEANKFLQSKTKEILNSFNGAETFSFSRQEPDKLFLTTKDGEHITLNSDEVYEIADYNAGFIRFNTYSNMTNSYTRGSITLRDFAGVEYEVDPIELALGLSQRTNLLQDNDYDAYINKKINSVYTSSATMLAVRQKVDTTDIYGKDITIVGQHAYIVKSIDDNSVTILNTYNTGEEIVLDLDNFKKISKFMDIETLKLD